MSTAGRGKHVFCRGGMRACPRRYQRARAEISSSSGGDIPVHGRGYPRATCYAAVGEKRKKFHARIVPGQYLFLLLMAALAFWSLWEKNILLAAVCMLWLVFLIERLIHTTYTLTVDGRLRIDRGRFSRRRERPLSDIVSVERASSMRVAGHALVSYVLVCYKDGKQDALQPVKEEEFIRSLTKRMAGDGPR